MPTVHVAWGHRYCFPGSDSSPGSSSPNGLLVNDMQNNVFVYTECILVFDFGCAISHQFWQNVSNQGALRHMERTLWCVVAVLLSVSTKCFCLKQVVGIGQSWTMINKESEFVHKSSVIKIYDFNPPGCNHISWKGKCIGGVKMPNCLGHYIATGVILKVVVFV